MLLATMRWGHAPAQPRQGPLLTASPTAIATGSAGFSTLQVMQCPGRLLKPVVVALRFDNLALNLGRSAVAASIFLEG